MYNRYIPKETDFSWVGEEPQKNHGTPSPPPKKQAPRKGKDPLATWLGKGETLFSGMGGLSGLLKSLHLEEMDSGDILLLLILLLLLAEGDDLELVIALGLVLVMGLGDNGGKSGE